MYFLLSLILNLLVLEFVNSLCAVQVIANFLGLLYSYLNISISKNIVPDEIKGREIHHSFPMTLFLVNEFSSPILVVLIKLTTEKCVCFLISLQFYA